MTSLETIKERKNIIILPNITSLIQYAIEATEKTNLTSKEKKQYALIIIDETIKALPSSKNKIFLQSCLDEGAISDTIDIIIDASKGKLDVNKKVSMFLKCLLTCFKSNQFA